MGIQTKVVDLGYVDYKIGADLFHVFPNNAITSIVLTTDGYQTVHTYPEYKKTVITVTTFSETVS